MAVDVKINGVDLYDQSIELDTLKEAFDEFRRVYKGRRDFAAMRDVRSWNIGDQVAFDLKKGGRACGTVIKLNRKTVTVQTLTHGTWRVSPSYLRPVNEPEQ